MRIATPAQRGQIVDGEGGTRGQQAAAERTSVEVELEKRLREHTARVSVIGQGYVGLPLAVELARAGFPVVGLDVDLARIEALNAGRPHTPDVDGRELAVLREAGRYIATADFDILANSDVVIICVPTPLRKSKDPDISYVAAAAEATAARFRPRQLVILESTTYPGTTEELLLSLFQRSEEHTSELQSRLHLVCRLLLEKKKIQTQEERAEARGGYQRGRALVHAAQRRAQATATDHTHAHAHVATTQEVTARMCADTARR